MSYSYTNTDTEKEIVTLRISPSKDYFGNPNGTVEITSNKGVFILPEKELPKIRYDLTNKFFIKTTDNLAPKFSWRTIEDVSDPNIEIWEKK